MTVAITFPLENNSFKSLLDCKPVNSCFILISSQGILLINFCQASTVAKAF